MFTNLIDVFRMGDDDLTKERTAIPANNKTPLAIAFASHDVLAITEGNDISPRVAVANGSTVSTYRITDDDTLEPISKAVPTNQTGACWIRFTPNGRFAYTGNTGSGSLSLFRISRHGELTLVAAKIVDTGGLASVPIDLDITPDGKYLICAQLLDWDRKGIPYWTGWVSYTGGQCSWVPHNHSRHRCPLAEVAGPGDGQVSVPCFLDFTVLCTLHHTSTLEPQVRKSAQQGTSATPDVYQSSKAPIVMRGRIQRKKRQ